MVFEKRPVSNVKTLQTTVAFQQLNGVDEPTFKIAGQDGENITIELCFLKGGKLSGVTLAGDENYFLEYGTGKYKMEGGAITFGPGKLTHELTEGLEGGRYSTHFGNLRTAGMHVYPTGITPFEYTLMVS